MCGANKAAGTERSERPSLVSDCATKDGRCLCSPRTLPGRKLRSRELLIAVSEYSRPVCELWSVGTSRQGCVVLDAAAVGSQSRQEPGLDSRSKETVGLYQLERC